MVQKKSKAIYVIIWLYIVTGCHPLAYGEIRPGFEQQWKDFRAAYLYHMKAVAFRNRVQITIGYLLFLNLQILPTVLPI